VHKALLLTGVRMVAEHEGGSASVHNEGFACAAPLTEDGYLLTVRHAVQEPVMALRRAIGRPDLKAARVVWSGDADGCDITILKVDWSGVPACRWAAAEAIAPGAAVLAAGCYLAEDEQHQWFRDDHSAGAVTAAPRATAATAAAPAFSLIEARLLVHPGDSGGPVLTADGRLVGVTMAHLLDPRTGASTGASLVIRPDTAFLDRVIAQDRDRVDAAQATATAAPRP
jgi:S1-C subfamily serine protease